MTVSFDFYLWTDCCKLPESLQCFHSFYKFVPASCRWVTSPWSECSASCGSGLRYRQITCQQVKANGSVLTLLPGACIHGDRPVGRKPCVGHLCAMGTIQTKGQVSHRVCLQSVSVSSYHWLNIFCTKEELCGTSCNYLSDQWITNPVFFSFRDVWATFTCWHCDLKPEY